MPHLSPMTKTRHTHSREGSESRAVGDGVGGRGGGRKRGMIFAVGEVGGSRQKSDGARADDTYETVTYAVRFSADSGRVDEEVNGERMRKYRERSTSSCSECDAAVASRPSRSGKIVALNSHAAAPAVRHETRITYGTARIEEPVRANRRTS